MAEISIKIPEELQTVIERHREIPWEQIAGEALWNYARKLQILDALTAQSSLTEEDIRAMGREIKRELAKHYETPA